MSGWTKLTLYYTGSAIKNAIARAIYFERQPPLYFARKRHNAEEVLQGSARS